MLVTIKEMVNCLSKIKVEKIKEMVNCLSQIKVGNDKRNG